MKSVDEIKTKIEELKEEIDSAESEYEENLEDEEVEEDSERGEELLGECERKTEALKKQIKILEWVLGE